MERSLIARIDADGREKLHYNSLSIPSTYKMFHVEHFSIQKKFLYSKLPT